MRPVSSGDLQCFSHLGTLNELPCMSSAGYHEEENCNLNGSKGHAKRKRTKASNRFGVCLSSPSTRHRKET